jgi:xanthine dehydrogenase accessory factor
LVAAGVAKEAIAKLHCPIGIDVGNNMPGEIAISTVAQLIERRDAWRRSRASSPGG